MTVTYDTYAFVENASSQDEWHVKIKEGDYAGIVYKYGRIDIAEPDNGEGDAVLKFQFKTASIPEKLDLTEEDLNTDETFMNLLGDILVHIIEDAMNSGKFKLGNNDKPTDSESTMHE